MEIAIANKNTFLLDIFYPLQSNAFQNTCLVKESYNFQTIIFNITSQLQKSNLLRLLSLHSCNDLKDAICLCEQSEAILLLNTFAITSHGNPLETNVFVQNKNVMVLQGIQVSCISI